MPEDGRGSEGVAAGRERPQSGAGIGPRTRRRLILGLVVSAAAALAAVGLLGQVADYGAMRAALAHARLGWLSLCVLGFVIAYGSFALGYRALARAADGPALPRWTAVRVVALGYVATLLASTTGGLAADAWALQRAGAGWHGAARRVAALSILRWLTLAGLVALTTVVGLATGTLHGSLAPIALAWLVCAPASVAMVFVGSLASRRAERAPPARAGAVSGPVRAPRRVLAGLVRAGLSDLLGGVALVRQALVHPTRFPMALAGLALYWAGELTIILAAVRAFAAPPALAALVVAYATAQLTTLIPLPGGGSGGIEAALAALLHLAGVGLAPSLLAAVVFRIFTFWAPAACGLALLPRLGHLDRELAGLGSRHDSHGSAGGPAASPHADG